MITKPTTFVLGAGASEPYGFPTGGSLVSSIARGEVQVPAHSDFFMVRDPGRALNYGYELSEFRDALREFNDGSIDEFLRTRPVYSEVGKIHIASALCAKEDPAQFHGGGPGRHWLKHLWQAMKAPPDQFSRNRVAFVVFNYDRAVEHFFTRALVSSYGLASNDDAWRAVSGLRIVHPHGLLGTYQPPVSAGRSGYADGRQTYSNQGITFDLVHHAAKRIRLFWEDTDDKEARELRLDAAFEECEQIVFLGFGFHRSNLAFLLPRIQSACSRRLVTTFASCYGESPMGQDRILGAMGGISHFASLDALDFLQHKVPLHNWSDSM